MCLIWLTWHTDRTSDSFTAGHKFSSSIWNSPRFKSNLSSICVPSNLCVDRLMSAGPVWQIPSREKSVSCNLTLSHQMESFVKFRDFAVIHTVLVCSHWLEKAVLQPYIYICILFFAGNKLQAHIYICIVFVLGKICKHTSAFVFKKEERWLQLIWNQLGFAFLLIFLWWKSLDWIENIKQSAFSSAKGN